MPPLAANRVTLRELADLAIGTPEVGTVNFTALHTLIVAILKNLNLQQVLIDFHYPSSAEPGRSAESIRGSFSTPQVSTSKEKHQSVTKQSSQQTLESQLKDLGSQVQDLTKQLKNMDNKVQGIVTHVEHISTATDLFQEFPKTEEETALLAPHISPQASPQTSLTKPIKIYESTEMLDKSEPTVSTPPQTQSKLLKTQKDTSPAKSSSALQDLVEDVKVLKEAHRKVQESPELNVQELLQRVNELEKVVKDREEYLDQLNRRLNLTPGTEEITMVTWEELEQAITDGWKASRGDSLVQPGMDQSGFVQPGADWSYAQPGVDQLDMAQPGAVQRGLVQPGTFPGGWMQPDTYSPGLVQPGIGQYGLVQPSVAQCSEDQRGLMQPVIDQLNWMQPGIDHSGAEESSLFQPGMGQQGLAQPGMDQQGFAQPRMYQYGFVEPGAIRRDLMQPGVQRRLVQPGMDQPGSLQPGADQPGLLQPRAAGLGMMQPGIIQPGAGPFGLVQPGVGPRGLVQPAVHMPSLAPLGAYPPGFIQPGPLPRGFPQPDAYPRGLRQHISSQPDFIAPSIELHGFPSDLYVTPEQARQDIFPVTDREGPDHQGPRIQYDQTQAVLGYPSGGHTVDASSQTTWDPSRKPALVQFELATTDQDTTDSSTRVSLSYLHQLSSGSEVHREWQESLKKLAPSFPMAVETFRLMGELVGLYMELKEHMKDLDEELTSQTDLEKVQYLLSMMVKKAIPQDLQEQMKSLKTLTKEVRKDKDRLEKIQRLIDGDGTAGKDVKPSQLTLQLGILRVTVSDIEKELSELRESQERGKAAMENSVSEASLYLQDQLNKLRTIIESMLSSSSTLLSLSITPHKSTSALVPGQLDPEATCPACSLDVGHQVSLLVQRYEQLQDMVNSLAASRPSKKAKLQNQDEELLGHVQSAILQVQGDCEKLNITTSNLLEDHRQKQKDIEVLYQGLERLEKKKADREHLEMEIDVKADKSALASKVSRIQFDATTEQLNHMMQELVAKMSRQEQDWQKLLDKLLADMDSKLDRLELDPVKQMLEDRWKSLRQQLKERSPLYQADEAAAMRRQLLAHFHCLSCDCPLETSVTGQVLSMTPIVPSMPGHRSIRPYTVFELEQVRQQSRNLKLGGSFSRGDLSQMERSVGHLRSMHSKMLMDIEKVQIHFGGSVKASSQMIRELMHSQCLSHLCYKRGVDTADYTYSTVPRRCGGSHTLTYPYRRNRPQHLSPLEEIQIAMKHDEVDILGLDGHIYKGRMDTRLPGTLGKDGMTKHKSKQMQQLQQAQQAQHARPHVHRQPSLGNGGLPPSRPQSAQMLADSNSVPSGQKKDRPVSSEGRLSQPNVAHASIPTEMASLQGSPSGLNVHMDVPPREGMEEPTRGPRSTTAH